LRHLFNAGEVLALRLGTVHNVFFYLNLMRNIRASIEEGRFREFKKEFARGKSLTCPNIQAHLNSYHLIWV
jgi:queuine tRNA-ribosyltransferase